MFILGFQYSALFGQLSCPELIEICSDGEIIINGEFPEGSYSIIFEDDFGNYIGSVSHQQVSLSPLIFTPYFSIHSIYGNYTVHYATQNLECRGNYMNNFCSQLFIFDTQTGCEATDTTICFNNPNLDEEAEYRRIVCQGDTSIVFKKTFDSEIGIEVSNLMLLQELGTIISETTELATIVWNDTGLDCMEAYAIIFSEIHVSTYIYNIPISVLPSSPLELYNENELYTTQEVCSGEQLSLNIKGDDIIEVVWELSDGRSFTGLQNNISFHNPGVYDLRIRDIGACECRPIEQYQIIVKSGQAPSFSCNTLTCPGEEITYFADQECTSYIWDINPSPIITQGGSLDDSYISFIWNHDTPGTISLSTPDCFNDPCTESLVEQVSVIPPTLYIEGEIDVCSNSTHRYTVPYIEGVEYDWDISSNGTIVSGHKTSSLEVDWRYTSLPRTSQISVSIENCELACQGSGILDINIRPILEFSVLDSVCYETSKNFFVSFGSTVQWILKDESGTTLADVTDDRLQHYFDTQGQHSLTVNDVNNTFCSDTETITFEVHLPPDSNLPVEQSDFACENNTIQYSIPLLNQDEYVNWYVQDGSLPIQTYETSKILYHKWETTGPYQIEYEVVNIITDCTSELSSIDILSPQIHGAGQTCTNEVAQYSITSTGTQEGSWLLSPANSGVIIAENNSSVDILWLEPVTSVIEFQSCNYSITESVDVKELAAYSYTHFPDCSILKSELQISTAASNNIAVYDEFKNLISTDLNILLDEGSYILEVTNILGCTKADTIEIILSEIPAISIETTQRTNICETANQIHMFVSKDHAGLSYQWYRNDVALTGLTDISYATRIAGEYYLEYTDPEACTRKTNSITIYDNCDDGGGCVSCDPVSIAPLGTAVIDNDCLSKNFLITDINQSAFYEWNVADPYSNNTFFVGSDIAYQFSDLGIYEVRVTSDRDCVDLSCTHCDDGPFTSSLCPSSRFEVVVTVIPDFSFKTACTDGSIQFLNETRYLFDTSVSYEWNFGDPNSGADNTSFSKDANHTFSGSGFYTVSLSASDGQGCILSFSTEVEVIPNFDLEIISDDEICQGSRIAFDHNAYYQNYEYQWEFGDPNTIENSSDQITSSHTYYKSGSYIVELSVIDSFSCEMRSVTKEITVLENNLDAHIETDKNPMCNNEMITLSTSQSNVDIIWSTGEVSSSIEITTPGRYGLTLTDQEGCTASEEIEIINYQVEAPTIVAIDNETSYTNEINICIGEPFIMMADGVNGFDYQWSNQPDNIQSMTYNPYFSNLAVGSYEIELEVTDIRNGCTASSESFMINILDLPEVPLINDANLLRCAGTLNEVSVENYDPSLSYRWDNGQIGPTLRTSSAGSYFVIASNSNGCTEVSDPVVISNRPYQPSWLTGCIERCLPDTICFNMDFRYDYELVKDGLNTGITFDYTDDFVIIDEAGDYQILITGNNGCTLLTEELSVNPISDSLSLNGYVFHDIDKNDTFESQDIGLENIWVGLFIGNTIVDSTFTDTSGQYVFDSLSFSAFDIKIRLGDLDFIGKLDSTIMYSTCIESKSIDFPLIQPCENTSTREEYWKCPMSSMMLYGSEYSQPSIDSVLFTSLAGCDSTVVFEIFNYDEPEITYSVEPNCDILSEASIEITTIQGLNLTFSIDPQSGFTTSNTIENISSGNQTLFVEDGNGCQYSYPFEVIDHSYSYTIATSQSCELEPSGTMSIENIIGGVSFSLEQDNFNMEVNFENLSTGNHTLYTMSNTGCVDSLEFNIAEYTYNPISLSIDQPCTANDSGSLTIDSPDDDYSFSLDGQTFSDELLIPDLSADNYTLFVSYGNGCITQETFTVENNQIPILDIEMNNTCENTSNASIQWNWDTNQNHEIEYNGAIYSENTTVENLSSGWHYYSILSNGCTYVDSLEIMEIPLPTLSYELNNPCGADNSGIIELIDLPAETLVSINGSPFTPNTTYDQLESGTYSLIVQNEDGCQSQEEIILEAQTLLEIEPMDSELCGTSELSIAPNITSHNGDLKYEWSDGSSLDELSIDQAGDYSLTISDHCNSEVFDFSVKMLDPNDNLIYMPNIFSPNRDNVNDCYLANANPALEIVSYDISIFDRKGNVVFKSDNIDSCWEGILEGQDIISGVYIYSLDIEYAFCTEVREYNEVGDITVMK